MPSPRPALRRRGHLHDLLAATPDNVAAGGGDGTSWTHRDLDLPGPDDQTHLPAGAVTALPAPDGRIVIASRAAESADVVLHYGHGTAWKGARVPLEGGVFALAIGVDGELWTAAAGPGRAPPVAWTSAA